MTTDRIRKIDAHGTITTVSTAPHFGSVFDAPAYGSLSVDPQGNLYYYDTANNFIRKIDQNGTDTVVVKGCNGCG